MVSQVIGLKQYKKCDTTAVHTQSPTPPNKLGSHSSVSDGLQFKGNQQSQSFIHSTTFVMALEEFYWVIIAID